MPSQQAEVGDGGRIWHLIFLTMKDDNAVAGANFFFSDGFLLSPLEQHEYLLPTYFTLNEILKMTQIQKLYKKNKQQKSYLIHGLEKTWMNSV